MGIINISKEQLEDIEKQIADLCKQLENSDLPKKLVTVLLYKLDDIDTAIKRYKRFGINDFEKVYDSFLGGLYKNRENLVTEGNKGILQKFADILKALRGITEDSEKVVDSTIKITEKVTDFLEESVKNYM